MSYLLGFLIFSFVCFPIFLWFSRRFLWYLDASTPSRCRFCSENAFSGGSGTRTRKQPDTGPGPASNPTLAIWLLQVSSLLFSRISRIPVVVGVVLDASTPSRCRFSPGNAFSGRCGWRNALPSRGRTGFRVAAPKGRGFSRDRSPLVEERK